MRTIIDAAAAYERALIRARTKAALGAKKVRGERAGNCPYGWRDAGDGTLERDAGEQTAAALAQQLQGEGLSVRGVMGELAARGVVGRTGVPLKLAAIACILSALWPPATPAE